jgi:hypothetical protein
MSDEWDEPFRSDRRLTPKMAAWLIIALGFGLPLIGSILRFATHR